MTNQPPTCRTILRGIVEAPPVIRDQHLEFPLRSGSDHYYIIRLEPAWQKQDIVFLDTGQVVDVIGSPVADRSMTILANRITICSHPISRLLHEKQEKKEKELYGYSGK
jgi:hypothetical protein